VIDFWGSRHKEGDRVKLHVTLVNSLFRNRESDAVGAEDIDVSKYDCAISF
jgi:hypothetical protein